MTELKRELSNLSENYVILHFVEFKRYIFFKYIVLNERIKRSKEVNEIDLCDVTRSVHHLKDSKRNIVMNRKKNDVTAKFGY